MGEWSRKTLWRQGSVLPEDASKALDLSHPESPERTFAVVISHDCDLVQDPGKEPFGELVTGRVIDAIKADSHAKTARRLQIEFDDPATGLAFTSATVSVKEAVRGTA